ncbi:MAG: restriction endonuclease subunit S [Dehalococcoidales bacterium]|nr:restriction endonuclease subunit S [Dehalococcoidales bacterium]
MNEWKECKLGDVADIVMGKSPKGETCHTAHSGMPLLNGPTEYGIKFPEPVQYTIDPKRRAKKGDILFCVRGSTTGRMNWADQEYVIGRGLASVGHKKGFTSYTYYKGRSLKDDFETFEQQGTVFGSIAPDSVDFHVSETGVLYDSPARRTSYEEVILKHTLESAINRLNPTLPPGARQEAFKAVLSVFSPQLITANEAFHKMLAEGVPVSINKEGQERGERVWLADFQNADRNQFFAINQFTVNEKNQNKRPN